MPTHAMIGGKFQLYRRDNSRFWQCSASVGGKQRKFSTKEESFELAKQVAEDWYLTLRGKDRAGLLTSEKTFRQAAEQFLKEYEIITEGQRSPRWVEGHKIRLRLHLLPFFGDLGVSATPRASMRPSAMRRSTGLATPRASTGNSPASAGATKVMPPRNWSPSWAAPSSPLISA